MLENSKAFSGFAAPDIAKGEEILRRNAGIEDLGGAWAADLTLPGVSRPSLFTRCEVSLRDGPRVWPTGITFSFIQSRISFRQRSPF